MDLISREIVKEQAKASYHVAESMEQLGYFYEDCIDAIPSAFEGMTNNEVHKALFGFELDQRYLVTDDTCIVADEDCPVCPLYNKTCNNRNFAEWLDSPYKGVSE